MASFGPSPLLVSVCFLLLVERDICKNVETEKRMKKGENYEECQNLLALALGEMHLLRVQQA